MSDSLPPYAVLLETSVDDVDQWKDHFDAHEPARVAAGCLGHHINRSEDDPNQITLFVALSDLDQAKAFTASEDLADEMKRAGVNAPPVMHWLQPIREEVIWDRQLPGMIVNHRVADFDKWLATYDSAGDLQAAKGIIGQAANRSLDDPSMVTIYHQAESFDTLRAFMDDPEVHALMAGAGVISEPEVTFHTGGWAKFY